MPWRDEYYIKIGGVHYKAKLLLRAKEFAKTGPLGLPEVEELWKSAQDGPGVTTTERRTLERIMQSHAVSTDALAFLAARLDGEHHAPSSHVGGKAGGKGGKIGKVRQEKDLLRLAEAHSRDGSICLYAAQVLWRSAMDGPGVTDTERRTLEHIMATYAVDEEAKMFLLHKLSLGSPGAAPLEPTTRPGGSPLDLFRCGKRRRRGQFTAAFVNPGSGNVCLDLLVEVLQGASKSLDVAVFMLTDDHLTEVILGRHKAGVQVRVLADNEAEQAFETSDLQRLREAGVQVRLDRSRLHMHHKFVVVDGAVCVTGSLNWTTGALRNNRENIVVSRRPSIATAFSAEFARLWTAFAPGASAEVGLAPCGSWSSNTTVLFFPDEGDANFRTLVAEVGGAQATLDVAIFTLTLPEMKAAMKDAKSRGVRVRVITDDHQAKFVGGGAHLEELRKAGLEVRMDGAGGNMHHKFCVVDGMTVCNGSFNWTRQAEDGNCENVVIYRSELDLARSFTSEFERLWAQFSG